MVPRAPAPPPRPCGPPPSQGLRLGRSLQYANLILFEYPSSPSGSSSLPVLLAAHLLSHFPPSPTGTWVPVTPNNLQLQRDLWAIRAVSVPCTSFHQERLSPLCPLPSVNFKTKLTCLIPHPLMPHPSSGSLEGLCITAPKPAVIAYLSSFSLSDRKIPLKWDWFPSLNPSI